MRTYRTAINDRLSLYSTTSNLSLAGVKPLRKKFADNLENVEPTPKTNSTTSILDCCCLETDGKGNIVDEFGRKITLKGINVDASAKLPVSPDMPTYKGSCDDPDSIYFDGDSVSFVGRPFPLEEAELHILRIKSWGYNTIRYIIVWEAIEHSGPGIYDEDFIDYTIKILDIIHKVGGIYVFLDPHQDVWSRFSGGSGAPLWTLYAAGLQPKRFGVTEAAILHNSTQFAHDPSNPAVYPKMIWPSNYKRLASFTMFTLFFAGAVYFPELTINGINIQHYLQDHYYGALKHIWLRITSSLPEMVAQGCLLGFESLNEPNCGLIGHGHLGRLPPSQQLRVGTTPTVFQAMKLGMGFPASVEVYNITVTGPQKSGIRVVDPKGARAWLLPAEAKKIDKHYGWKRGPQWKLGICIFAQRRIWKWDKLIDLNSLGELSEDERITLSRYKCELVLPNFFNQVSLKIARLDNPPKSKKITMEYFTNNFFMDFYIKHKQTMRDVTPDSFVFMHSPVLEIPPDIKSDIRHIIDSKTIYTPHYYDGMSIMFKTWNSKYNVDTLGIMRNRYYNPVLGCVFGERAIRNCIKKQFIEMKQEAEQNLGSIPVLMSETGMPFDMDDKKAYDDGKYYPQTSAMDALGYALEGLNLHHTYWVYSSINSHKWGDHWNNEDFSFWSPEDRNLLFDDEASESPTPEAEPLSRQSSLKASIKSVQKLKANGDLKKKIRRRARKLEKQLVKETSAEQAEKSELTENSEPVENSEAYDTDEFDFEKGNETDTLSCNASLISSTTENVQFKHNRRCYPSPDGVRAVGAVIRPYVVATRGTIKIAEFDLKSVRYGLCLSFKESNDRALDRKTPTVIFLPKWHYPNLNYGDIYLTSGTVKYNEQLEYLEWYHDEDINDEETIVIKNNSGSLFDLKERERKGLLALYADDMGCPIT